MGELLTLTVYEAATNGQNGAVSNQPYAATPRDTELMGLALSTAGRAASSGDSPIGAVLVDPEGEIYVDETYEFRNQSLDEHAEMRLVRRVQPKLGRNLGRCSLYTVAEPCYGCCYLLDKGGIGRVYIAARRSDVDFFTRKKPEMDDIFTNSRRRFEVVSGLLLPEAKKLLVTENRRHWDDKTFTDQLASGA